MTMMPYRDYFDKLNSGDPSFSILSAIQGKNETMQGRAIRRIEKAAHQGIIINNEYSISKSKIILDKLISLINYKHFRLIVKDVGHISDYIPNACVNILTSAVEGTIYLPRMNKTLKLPLDIPSLFVELWKFLPITGYAKECLGLLSSKFRNELSNTKNPKYRWSQSQFQIQKILCDALETQNQVIDPEKLPEFFEQPFCYKSNNMRMEIFRQYFYPLRDIEKAISSEDEMEQGGAVCWIENLSRNDVDSHSYYKPEILNKLISLINKNFSMLNENSTLRVREDVRDYFPEVCVNILSKVVSKATERKISHSFSLNNILDISHLFIELWKYQARSTTPETRTCLIKLSSYFRNELTNTENSKNNWIRRQIQIHKNLYNTLDIQNWGVKIQFGPSGSNLKTLPHSPVSFGKNIVQRKFHRRNAPPEDRRNAPPEVRIMCPKNLSSNFQNGQTNAEIPKINCIHPQVQLPNNFYNDNYLEIQKRTIGSIPSYNGLSGRISSEGQPAKSDEVDDLKSMSPNWGVKKLRLNPSGSDLQIPFNYIAASEREPETVVETPLEERDIFDTPISDPEKLFEECFTIDDFLNWT